jgi:hypothetical protein
MKNPRRSHQVDQVKRSLPARSERRKYNSIELTLYKDYLNSINKNKKNGKNSL